MDGFAGRREAMKGSVKTVSVAIIAAASLAGGCNQRDSVKPATSADSRRSAPPPSKAQDKATDAAAAFDKQPASDPASASAASADTQAADTQATGDRETAAIPDKVAAQDAPGSPQAEPKSQKKSHEPIFEGWSKPDVTLLLTGCQEGYIEPCGCTGLSNQKGGMARRHSLIKDLQNKGWEVVSIDVGNQIRRFGRQAEIKFQMSVAGLTTMKYRAISFGPDDLRLPAGDLYSIAVGEDESKSPFLCANAAIFEDSFTKKFQIVEAGNKKIGITAVLGEEEIKKVTNDEIVVKPADEALAEVWPLMEQAKCDVYVLLTQAPIEETIQLAQKYPHFDLVVTSGGGGEPKMVPDQIPDTSSLLIQVGKKGMYAGVAGLFGKQWKYQRVPLDDRFADSPAMLQLLESYQDQLKTLGLQGLGLKPVQHPSGYQFVGSEKCGECHTTAYSIWEKTPHAQATEHLVHPGERAEISRHFDPECLSCHVTGWNPQQYFPYASGYLDLKKSAAMHGSGCENCHGPGSQHVAAEQGDIDVDEAMQEKHRLEMRLPLDKAEIKCLECHDLDNSPDFHLEGAFEKYWKPVEHKGMD